MITIPVVNPFPELPEGIAIEGGAARAIARKAITGEIEPIRDVDLVCLNWDMTNETLDRLASTYMKDDHDKGCHIHRVTINEYFKTRDFTLNEVLVVGNELLVSEEALKAYKTREVTVSKNERITSRTAAKAQYLKAVLETATGKEHSVDNRIERRPCHLRDVALFLNKAMSRGRAVAERYAQNAIKSGIMLFENSDPVEMANYCSKRRCYRFRNSAYEKDNSPDSYSEEEWTKANGWM